MIAKNIGIGFLIGIVANAIGIFLYLQLFSDLPIKEALQTAIQQDILGKIISLGALLNLGAFFIFIKKRDYYKARGVLLATVLAAIFTLISKFM